MKMFTLDEGGLEPDPPDNNTGIQFPPTLQVSDALTGDNAQSCRTPLPTCRFVADVKSKSPTTPTHADR